jgi:tetratricopeptide (TPR) repeat protein
MKKIYVILIMALLGGDCLFAQDACKKVIEDGIQMFNNEQYAKAKERFETAKKINCTDAQMWIDKCNAICETMLDNGIAQFNSGKYAEAKERFETAQKNNCGGVQSWIEQCNEKLKPPVNTGKSLKEMRCEQLWKDGKDAFDKNDYETALVFFKKGADDKCNNADFADYIELCNIKLKTLENPDKSPKQVQCEQRYKDGKGAYEKGDYETALMFFKKGLNEACKNVDFKDQIELCNMKLAKQKEAGQANLQQEDLQKSAAGKFAQEPELELKSITIKNNMPDSILEIPIMITSLKIGNVYKDGTVETPYGDKLYSSTSMYLKPQIEFIGLQKCESIKLHTKLYYNETLRSNAKTSPPGYTSLSGDIFVAGNGKQTKDFAAWGSSTQGFFPAGDYRYEIWYNEMLLEAIDFQVH